MSVLINAKYVEMPECCNRCFFSDFCIAHKKQVWKMKESKHEQIFDVFGEMRLGDCPLVEVEERHMVVDDGNGHANARKVYRLVEKYRLYNHLEGKYCEGCTKMCDGSCTVEKMLDDIDDFPTVLEASATTQSRNHICPYYQGVCGLDENILCYCSSSYETCDTYKESSE